MRTLIPQRRLLLRGGLALVAATVERVVWAQDAANAERAVAPGQPHIASWEAGDGRAQARVMATCPFSYAQMREALSSPVTWCEVMVLPTYHHACVIAEAEGRAVMRLRMGRGPDSAIASAVSLQLAFHQRRNDTNGLELSWLSDVGPYGTTENELSLQLKPEGTRTNLLMTFGCRTGVAARIASQAYLSTLGRGKVGFSQVDSGSDKLVGGMRGIVERSAMRYYLAVTAWMQAAGLPVETRAEARARYWFDATERFPRQLRELDRAAYLDAKRFLARPSPKIIE